MAKNPHFDSLPSHRIKVSIKRSESISVSVEGTIMDLARDASSTNDVHATTSSRPYEFPSMPSYGPPYSTHLIRRQK